MYISKRGLLTTRAGLALAVSALATSGLATVAQAQMNGPGSNNGVGMMGGQWGWGMGNGMGGFRIDRRACARSGCPGHRGHGLPSPHAVKHARRLDRTIPKSPAAGLEWFPEKKTLFPDQESYWLAGRCRADFQSCSSRRPTSSPCSLAFVAPGSSRLNGIASAMESTCRQPSRAESSGWR